MNSTFIGGLVNIGLRPSPPREQGKTRSDDDETPLAVQFPSKLARLPAGLNGCWSD
jgi:hypothetical protein